MDPFWHHNRYWMTRRRRPMKLSAIVALIMGFGCAVVAMFYSMTGRDGTAVLYASIGLGILLTAAWRGDRRY